MHLWVSMRKLWRCVLQLCNRALSVSLWFLLIFLASSTVWLPSCISPLEWTLSKTWDQHFWTCQDGSECVKLKPDCLSGRLSLLELDFFFFSSVRFLGELTEKLLGDSYIRSQKSCSESTHIHPSIHTWIRTHIHTCMHTWLHGYMATWIHGRMDTWIQGYMDTYLPMYVRTYIHTDRHTDRQTDRQTDGNTHTCLHTYIPIYLHTYIPRWIHAYMHACMHTYAHTHIFMDICIYIYIWHTYIYRYINTYVHDTCMFACMDVWNVMTQNGTRWYVTVCNGM